MLENFSSLFLKFSINHTIILFKMARTINSSYTFFLIAFMIFNLGVSFSRFNGEYFEKHLTIQNNVEAEESKKNDLPNLEQNSFHQNPQQAISHLKKWQNLHQNRLLLSSNSSNFTNSTNSSNYTNSSCGDSIIQADQQCDDGNTIGGDGCNQLCQLELCGDGIVTGMEECDDGNTASGDGCSSDCKVEASGTSLGGISVCGDGQIQGQQQCDDGNTKDGDGCSSTCKNQFRSLTLPLALGIPLGVGAIAGIGVAVFLILKKSAVAAASAGMAGPTETAKINSISQQQLPEIQ